MNRAIQIVRSLNPYALVSHEDGLIIAIEDVVDEDGNMYRLEYQSTPDGECAVAYCLSNPWDENDVTAGFPYHTAHVASDGFVCLGPDCQSHWPEDSPYDLKWTIKRARYWCTGFSFLCENGYFPNL